MERGGCGKPAGRSGAMPAGVLELPYGRDVSARTSRIGCGPETKSASRAALPLRWRASAHSTFSIYGEQGRFSDAIAEFTIAVRVTPNDPEYLTNLATAFAAVGRTGDARRALEAAIAAAPDYNPARVALEQIGTK